MSGDAGLRIYEEMGVTPMINASGNQTVIGGSSLAPKIQEAMEAANAYFVDMKELLKRTGEIVAETIGCEAALVTPGCAAALALSSAACMAGDDPEKQERLPDTTGMEDEFLIQRGQRYKYDRCYTIFGGKLVEVGDEAGTTADQMTEAIGAKTAALVSFAPGTGKGILSTEELIGVGNEKGIPVIVDAAASVYPLERMSQYTRMGASLVGFGAKYFGSCNSTGLLCGRRELVDLAFDHCFIGFETGRARTVGRPLKLDRQEVVATVVALREWFTMDHEARFAENRRRSEVILKALEGIPSVSAEPVKETRGLGDGVRLTLDEAALGKTASQVREALLEGRPKVWLRETNGNTLHVVVHNLRDTYVDVVAERLREALG